MLLHHLFIRTAKRYSKKLAFIDKATGKRITYGQSLIGALILAKRFARFKDHHLGIMLPTSAGCGLSVVATLFTGKTPVMINYSTGAEKNIEFARRKVGFTTVITSRKLLQKVGCPHMEGMVYVEDIIGNVSVLEKIMTALRTRTSESSLIRSVAQGSEKDTAVLLFTSGSEKDPKGVELSHKNIYADIVASVSVMAVTDEDVMMAILPQFHVFGYTICFWLPVANGMTTVTYPNPLDARNVVDVIRSEKPTLLVGTPYFVSSYLKQSEPGDFESLRLIVTGADKTPDWLHEAMRKKHGKQIFEGYGATETSPVIAVNPHNANRPGTVGKPLPGIQVKIVDFDTEEALPPGREGKLLVKGDTVMKGYFDDIELTSRSIHNGWYDTGDMAFLDHDGYLHHRGRLRRFVKIGGEMVSLFAVEVAMQNILPPEVDCCAVEVPDSTKGAQIALALTQTVDVRMVRDALAQELPAIAIPRHFFVFPELPKMGNGKADFRAVSEMVYQKYGKGRDEAANGKNEAVEERIVQVV